MRGSRIQSVVRELNNEKNRYCQLYREIWSIYY
jgi:hypothetical protein